MTEEDKKLIEEAKRVRAFAYAPYSHFAVGAALRTKSGKVYNGCNIENSAFPMTMCAERIAVFRAVSAGERDFDTIAVIADSPSPTPPCGACRQVLAEFGVSRVIMANVSGDTGGKTLDEVLPGAFTKEDM